MTLDEAPIGLFEIDSNGRVIYANVAALRILGYRGDQPIVGLAAKQLYKYSADREEIRRRLRSNLPIRDYPVVLQRSDASPVVVALSLSPNLGSSTGLQGAIGSIREASIAELYHDILMEAPVGLFIISRTSDDQEVLDHCNLYFARLTERSDPAELKGVKISRLHKSEEFYREFRLKIDQQPPNVPLVHHNIKMRTRSGRELEVDTGTVVRRDMGNREIGRVGYIHDVTNIQTAQRELREMAHSTSSVFHALTHSFIAINQTITHAVDTIAHDRIAQERPLANSEIRVALSRSHR